MPIHIPRSWWKTKLEMPDLRGDYGHGPRAGHIATIYPKPSKEKPDEMRDGGRIAKAKLSDRRFDRAMRKCSGSFTR